MNIRMPVQAGRFYEGSTDSCRRHVQKLLDEADLPADLPARLFGGVVPHAGWVFSGALAARTFCALAEPAEDVRTFVLLGTDHTGTAAMGEVFASGVWRTPLGDVAVDDALADELLAGGGPFRDRPAAHSREHSLEVQLPILQVLLPEARILPIAVHPLPQHETAVEIGRYVGQLLRHHEGVRVVASTDLTHHGRDAYGFGPGGPGQQAADWTRENDARVLRLVEALDADAVVPEAAEHHNACGAGAVAAALAAVREAGATRGIVLEYSTSYDVARRLYADENDDTAVGYASVVFA